MTEYDRTRWHVVVGLGSAGSRHLRILSDLGVSRIAVVRTNSGPTSRPTPTGVRECRSLDEALALEPVAVVIATPTSMHAAQAVAALDAGASVLVEKPLATSLDDTRQVLEAATRNDRTVVAGFHLRHHPAYAWLARVARDRDIGRPLIVRASWGEYLPDWHPGEDYSRGYAARAEQGGGPLLTLSHVVDYSVGILGPVATAAAIEGRVSTLDIDVPDVAVVGFTHLSGATSSVEVDFVTRPARHHVELRCERGSVEWDVLARTLTVAQPAGAPDLRAPDISAVTRDWCFIAQMRTFLSELESGSSRTYGHELAVAHAIQAAVDSAAVRR